MATACGLRRPGWTCVWPFKVRPEEVPGPGGAGLSFLVLRGRDRLSAGPREGVAPSRPRGPRPVPMALVTVSRSPPASGQSTPVGPTVSLAWLWSRPRSWLPVGPGGVLAAHRQPPLKPGGVRRGPSRLRLERLRGDLEATRNSDQGKIQSPERPGRPYPVLGPDLGQTLRHLQQRSPSLNLWLPVWTWARLRQCLHVKSGLEQKRI